MDNQTVAKVLGEISEILQILGESRFKINAYSRAARAIMGLTQDLVEIYKEGGLEKIPGVGKSIAQKIEELLLTGRLSYHEELLALVPRGVMNLMMIPHVGPKKAKLFYDELAISDVEELYLAAKEGRLQSLPKMGKKAETAIIAAIEDFCRSRERILLSEAYPLAEKVIGHLKKNDSVWDISSAGSLRRMKETIGDIDILVSSNMSEEVFDDFTQMDGVLRVIERGRAKASVMTEAGLQVDLRVVSPNEYGSALQYFTGSKEHNVRLRDFAKRRGYKISEYGIFDAGTGTRLGGRREEEIYKVLGMKMMDPTLREDKGEIEAALSGSLPELIEIGDVRGDLHVHSNYSDGLNRIEELAASAKDLGYEYIAISDHAEGLKVARGLTKNDLKRQFEEIDLVNEKIDNFRVLKGIELNIELEGDVDFETDFLEEFDIVIAAIHSGFSMAKDELTARMIRAMENPNIDIIGHPTGRILGKRPPYQLDLDRVFEAAAKTGTLLELNSLPERLDLKDEHLKKAKEAGARFAIDTDAHNLNQLKYIFFGVATAKRGWLTREDVVNAHPLNVMLSMLEKN
ncbi:MAG: DNA polymerase/3'-5' exonuclease PolX [Actinomycetota bacterium]|nr:DNA polymerase/3'-5' exonuclease PolX [Actinomycetota bacterium]